MEGKKEKIQRTPEEAEELVQRNYRKAKAQAARAEKKEKQRNKETQRRNAVKKDVRDVVPGTVTCEIRPAHWCNICYRAFPCKLRRHLL